MKYTKVITVRTQTETLRLEIEDTGDILTSFGEPNGEPRNYLMEVELEQHPEPVTKIVRWELPTLIDPYELTEEEPEEEEPIEP